MDKKKTKRRRTTRRILAFFVLFWLGLSVYLYFSATSPANVYTMKIQNPDNNHFWITREGDEYVCVNDSREAPVHGGFGFEHEYTTYASRTNVVLKEEWCLWVVADKIPEDADREKLLDQAYALLVSQGFRRNWPNITRAQAKSYVVEYPKLQAANKRAIALHSFWMTTPGLAVLCFLVLMTRYVYSDIWTKPVAGICPDCDYNLGGLKDQKCPECGRAFSDEEWFFHMPG